MRSLLLFLASVAVLWPAGLLAEDAPAPDAASYVTQLISRFDSKAPVHMVIATVPDPQYTQLGLYFDEALDAMSAAAVQARFVALEHWLPWTRTDDKEEPTTTGTGADPKLQPGVLAFRSSQSNELLIVLLVGEMTTAGTHEAALAAAIGIARSIDSRSQLRVLGPFFSGSAPELVKSLGKTPASVISGSATALEEVTGIKQKVVPDRDMLRFVRAVLPSDADNIVMLRESGTAYGGNLERAKPQAASPSQKAVFKPSDAMASLRTPSSEAVARDLQPDQAKSSLVYRFPLHISQLRAAESTAAPAPDTIALRRTLPLRINASPIGSDSLPVLSVLTPSAAEMQLRASLRAIAASGARYLIIGATDPLDFIYLVQKTRSYCPDVQIIGFGASLLYSHPDHMADMSGVMFASSYPLSLQLQARSAAAGDSSATLSFGSDTGQGIYNAMTQHLSDMHAGDQTVVHAQEPRMWLSMLNDGRLWPIAAGEAADDKQPLTPWSWARPTAFAMSMGIALTVFIVMAAWLTRIRVVAGVTSFIEPWRGAVGSNAASYVAATSFVLCFYGLLIFICAGVTYDFRSIANKGLLFALLGACVTRLVLPLALILLVSYAARSYWEMLRQIRNRFRSFGARDRPAIAEAFIALILLTLAACAGHYALTLHDVLSGRGIEPALLWLRLRDPIGMSPLAPLFFLALACYFWGTLGASRVRANRLFAHISPFWQWHNVPSGARLSAIGSRLDRHWRKQVMTSELMVLGLLIFPAGMFATRALPSFEAPAFDRLVMLLFICLTAANLLLCVHFNVLWRLTAELMSWLVSRPMLDSYERIASKFTNSFGFQLRSQVPSAQDLVISVGTCRTLATTAANFKDDNDISKAIARSAPALKRIAARLERAYGLGSIDKAAPPRPSLTEREIHMLMFRASAILDATLERIWRVRSNKLDLKAIETAVGLDNLLPQAALGQVPTPALFAYGIPAPLIIWIRAAEDFVAMRAVTFLYHLLNQLRILITLALLISVCLVCAVYSYPLEPHRFVTVCSGGVLIVVAALALRVIIGMDRSELLIRLGRGGGSSRLNIQKWMQVGTYVALPLTILLARVFPELGERIGSILQPLFSVLQ